MQRLTIIAHNTQGLFADIAELLANNKIDINSVDSQISDQDVYIHMMVSDYDLSLRLLTQAGYNVASDESVLLRVKDAPGALAKLSRRISDHGIDTRSMSMLHQNQVHSIVAISTDNNTEVLRLFSDIAVYQR